MCIRCEMRKKNRRSLAFSPVSKPHTHITYMIRQCTSIVYKKSLNISKGGNQNPQIEDGQTTQWQKEKGQKYFMITK